MQVGWKFHHALEGESPPVQVGILERERSGWQLNEKSPLRLWAG